MLYLAFAVAMVLLSQVLVLDQSHHGPWVDTAAMVGLAGVAACLVVGTRRGVFHLPADVLASIALGAVVFSLHDLDAVAAAPLGYVMVRSAHGTSWTDVVGSALAVAGYVLAALVGARTHGTVPPLAMLLTGTAVMALFLLVNQTLVRSLAREGYVQARLQELAKMQAVGRLAAGIAHDFNNLLTAVRGHAEFILRDAPAGAASSEDAQAIIASADRGRRLVEHLLAYAKRQRLIPSPVSVDQVVREMGPLLRQLLGEDVRVSLDLADGGPAMVDRTQLEQVILNLAANARDAMPGGGRLHLTTRRVPVRPRSGSAPAELDPGAYVALSVRDTGRGMDEETRARAFEPFFTGRPLGEGTGLGLSIVQGIASQSGGAVTLESEPGRGSLFTVWLPAPTPAPDGPGSADPAPGALHPGAGG